MSVAQELSDDFKGYVENTKQVIRETFDSYSGSIDALRNRISDLEAYRNRVGLGGVWQGDSETRDEINKGLRAFLKHGDASGLRSKGMSVGSDPDGGFLVPHELSNSIVQTIFESSPVRQVSRIVSIETDSFEEILDKDQVGASWVEETGSRAETSSPEIGKINIPAREVYCAPKVTQKLLDDSKIDIAQWLSDKVSDKFARSEATAFVSGDGVGKPRGFLSYATAATGDATRSWGTLEHIPTGAAGDFHATLPGDALISAVFKLKAGYRRGATWMMNSATIAAVRKLKDADSHYLWQPSMTAGQPDLLLGYPVLAAEDMPAIAANSLSIAFGNFGRGYVVVDRHPMRMLRDPYTAKPWVVFYCYRRTGGDVTNFEAIKLLRFATT